MDRPRLERHQVWRDPGFIRAGPGDGTLRDGAAARQARLWPFLGVLIVGTAPQVPRRHLRRAVRARRAVSWRCR